MFEIKFLSIHIGNSLGRFVNSRTLNLQDAVLIHSPEDGLQNQQRGNKMLQHLAHHDQIIPLNIIQHLGFAYNRFEHPTT
jgi:hypothetical protein